MKFSEISRESWTDLQPYLDTCLLPITGLTGGEPPWEAGDRLEDLRDALDLIEVPFHGRVVTYPAVQYVPGQAYSAAMLTDICAAIRATGFRYIVAVTAEARMSGLLPAEADLQIYAGPEQLQASYDEVKRQVTARIQSMWAQGNE
ncbi:DUF2487 family protein [Paenibacillus chartarius]|uniref:DUF2487 family protein n=1 Tax=Paenibacillus chartarius TaxID=747481 RepID=A0ABV6DQB1_9BACL